MIPWQSLVEATLFRLSALSWIDLLDLLLVTTTFYLLLRLIQRTRAALLLRGVLVLSGVLFVVTIVLPLPAFDWVVRGALLAILIATPIIFQPELRRLLEQIGRTTGPANDGRADRPQTGAGRGNDVGQPYRGLDRAGGQRFTPRDCRNRGGHRRPSFQ